MQWIFFLSPPSPVEECKEGHLSFWKGSLFYKDHNTVCLTRPWPSDYLWCPHYVIHLVWLGEEAEREGGREKEMKVKRGWGTSASSQLLFHSEGTFLLVRFNHALLDSMQADIHIDFPYWRLAVFYILPYRQECLFSSFWIIWLP